MYTYIYMCIYIVEGQELWGLGSWGVGLGLGV